MSEPRRERQGFDFRLTLRQRRLRVLTAFVVLLILGMVGFGVRHPFFRSAGEPEVRALARQAVVARRMGQTPSSEAERARRAAAVRIAFIGAYWSGCFLLSGALLVLAWLDAREIRRKLVDAQRTLARSDPTRHGAEDG
ncbi:MAG: hypothetical protein FJX72_11235 [Armatimonadetes bacterium]|nr:hypothetical protein [Armatimonadota bacterium]